MPVLRSAHHYPFHRYIVKQFSKLNVFEGALQIQWESHEEGVADAQTHGQLESECLPTILPRKGPQLEVLSSMHCCRVGKMHGAQSLRASSLLSPLCFPARLSYLNLTLSIAFCTIFREISSRSNTPTSTQTEVLFTHIHSEADIHSGLDTHLHMQTHTLIQRMSVTV